ncbi:MAG TPA: hypothetical protein PLU45_04445, partial [Bacteroidales bacterium]|nr:hypothetical protein [Bacteroidales bacterium]
DGLVNQGCKVTKDGEQIRGTNFYLLTYGKNNERYIEKKSQNNWRLYTQVGELETLRKQNKEGVRDKSRIRYHHFATFEECIEKLYELNGNSAIEICDSDTFPILYSNKTVLSAD